MPVEIQPKTVVGGIILRRIKDLGTTVRAVADRIDVEYETLRQVVKGDRAPARRLLRDVARELKLDFDDLWEKVVLEKMQVEAPGLLLRLAGTTDMEVLALARNWTMLTQEQKEHIRWLVDSFVAKNKGQANQFHLSSRTDELPH